MIYKFLGKTDLRISAVGQGTTGTGGYINADSAKDKNRIKVLRYGISLGMNFIDTAELYGGGTCRRDSRQDDKGTSEKNYYCLKI